MRESVKRCVEDLRDHRRVLFGEFVVHPNALAADFDETGVFQICEMP